MFDRFLFLTVCALTAFAVFSVAPARAQVDVRIGAGTVLDGGAARLAVSGDLSNDGTFTPNRSTVAFTGADDQTVNGVGDFSSLTVDKPDGATFSLGTGVAVNDTLTLTGGTFDNGAANVALGNGATIRRRAGTLAAAPTFGATVNIAYEGDEAVATGNEVPAAGSGTAVQDFTVSNAGGVTLTAPVEVNGRLSLNEGTLDNTQAGVTMSESGSVEPGAGNISETPIYEGPVVIVYGGRTARTTDTELPDTTNRLVIDNAAGVTLGKDVHILDTLAMQSGMLALDGHTVTLAPPNAVLLEAPGAVIFGESGEIRATRTLDAPQEADVAGLGFRITSDADLGSTTVARSHAAPFDDKQVAIARVYTVTPTNNSGLDAAIAFSYAEAELGEVVEEPMRLYRSDDGENWFDVGGAVDTTANVVALDGLNRLTRFTAGAPKNKVDAEDASGLPQTFELHGNFPNPFHTQTTIRYALSRAARVRLEVYDLLGRRVATLADEQQPAGTHAATFDAADLPAGVYFARIQAGEHVATRRLVRVR